jgi:hypothetical protein
VRSDKLPNKLLGKLSRVWNQASLKNILLGIKTCSCDEFKPNDEVIKLQWRGPRKIMPIQAHLDPQDCVKLLDTKVTFFPTYRVPIPYGSEEQFPKKR